MVTTDAPKLVIIRLQFDMVRNEFLVNSYRGNCYHHLDALYHRSRWVYHRLGGVYHHSRTLYHRSSIFYRLNSRPINRSGYYQRSSTSNVTSSRSFSTLKIHTFFFASYSIPLINIMSIGDFSNSSSAFTTASDSDSTAPTGL